MSQVLSWQLRTVFVGVIGAELGIIAWFLCSRCSLLTVVVQNLRRQIVQDMKGKFLQTSNVERMRDQTLRLKKIHGQVEILI